MGRALMGEAVTDEADVRVEALQRLLGKKTLENEMLKKAVERGRSKNWREVAGSVEEIRTASWTCPATATAAPGRWCGVIVPRPGCQR
ncbi:hypothetical protein J7J64_09010 [Lysobacter sp. ISL-42]|nr:hypothetical protein [Lysobacter sp. ISL-42]MBT2754002.1 hypothetical protein [Lysobacter sp. ISL-50]MBT2778924.1 hypothetical protein [Lysobacter sp. ISL-54]MBT2782499.1 hypothetical protein [Lysobacter sp. ISL-52]